MALEILLVKQPFEACFTGNPIEYVFALTPYGNFEKGQDIRISVKICIELEDGSGYFAEVKNQSFFPDSDGVIRFDIKTIIHPYLNYYTPKSTLSQPVSAPSHTKRFKIVYQLLQDGAVVGFIMESSIATAIKGGMAYEQWHPSDFFSDVVLIQKKTLNFDAPGEMVGKDETRFIYWLYPYNDGLDQIVGISVKFDDGTVNSTSLTPHISCGKWGVCCFPSGYDMLNLNTLLTSPARSIVSYKITIYNTGFTTICSKEFLIDYRNFYRTEQLLFRNSLGALETIRLRGQIDFEADYNRQSAVQIVPPSYFNSGILIAQSVNYNTEETEKKMGDTGFLSKPAQQKLRDIFLTQEIYELDNGRYLPVVINSKNVKFYSNRDSLIAIQIEWLKAYVNEFFTPKGLMPSTRSCPDVQTLFASQINKNTLRIMWALPTPYDQVKIVITVPNTTTGIDDVYIYYYQGNAGVEMQYFDNPATTAAITIVVDAYVVCDPDNTPMDLGGRKRFVMSVDGPSAPVANIDTFNIPAGYASAVTLSPSVLANDYDPDGDPIEVVAASGPTGRSGSYSINNAGIVTYTPPSSIYIGQDYIFFTVQKVGGSLSSPSLCYINVNSSIIPVFAKMFVTGSGSGTQVSIYFYSNNIGTVALDVTGFGLTINYTETVNYIHGGGTTIIPKSVGVSGTQVIIWSGALALGGGTVSFALSGGTGYTAI